MSHLEEVSAQVDAAIEAGVITGMNELLVILSDDAALSREERFEQQKLQRMAPKTATR